MLVSACTADEVMCKPIRSLFSSTAEAQRFSYALEPVPEDYKTCAERDVTKDAQTKKVSFGPTRRSMIDPRLSKSADRLARYSLFALDKRGHRQVGQVDCIFDESPVEEVVLALRGHSVVTRLNARRAIEGVKNRSRSVPILKRIATSQSSVAADAVQTLGSWYGRFGITALQEVFLENSAVDAKAQSVVAADARHYKWAR